MYEGRDTEGSHAYNEGGIEAERNLEKTIVLLLLCRVKIKFIVADSQYRY